METIENKVTGMVAELEAAWNAADGSRFAAPFAEDADFIHVLGGRGRGRASIADAHSRLFETIYRDSRVSFRLDSQRTIGPTVVALLEQKLSFQLDGRSQSMTCRPTLVLERSDDALAIVLMHNTRVAETAADARDLTAHPFAPR